MTINTRISDRELSDLKHRYRNDFNVTRIIEALEAAEGHVDKSGRLRDALRDARAAIEDALHQVEN